MSYGGFGADGLNSERSTGQEEGGRSSGSCLDVGNTRTAHCITPAAQRNAATAIVHVKTSDED